MSKELEVYGSIKNVLFSRVTKDNLHERKVADAGFSFGLGGFDINNLSSLGELVTCPGNAAVLPANNIEKAITGKEGSYYTPFNVRLTGIGNNKLQTLNGDSKTISAYDIFNTAISGRKNDGSTSPLFGCAWFSKIELGRGSYLKKSPVLSNAPAGGKPISDPEVHPDWFGADPIEGDKALRVIAIGIAIDYTSQGISDLDGLENNIFYKNPNDPAGSKEILIHQHAFILQENPGSDNKTNESIKNTTAEEATNLWLNNGTIIDAKHILDDSIFSDVYYTLAEYDSINHIF